ncbi:hypothetical protein A2U01_0089816, partial [Trifolium medium]|nr:hypothetical protein [Trifolium medium]
MVLNLEQSFDTSVDDVEFDFLDVGGNIIANAYSDHHDQCHSIELDLDDDDNEKEKDKCDANEKDRSFWDTQHQ